MSEDPILSTIDSAYPSLLDLYRDLHAHPELSGQEAWTAERLAGELEQVGCRVTRGVGGHGVVAIFANGEGPALLVRADMDGLPVREETGLPYQSRVRMQDSRGREVDVMHACGHDIHMTALVGAAWVLTRLRDRWSGTLVLVGQPSEESVSGAARMVADSLYSRFPRPSAGIALHVAPDLPAGTIGYREGIFSAGSESLDIVIPGIGGHAAHPDQTRDPVVTAAQVILAFQTIVSRELPPLEFGIITVASVHGGLKHNAIPDEVLLQANIRYFKKPVRDLLLNAIRRVTEGVVKSAGLPASHTPRISLLPESVPPMTNDPALTTRVTGALARVLGSGSVVRIDPLTGSEDFGVFGFAEPPLPLCYFRVGCADPPGSCGFLHSSRFSPPPAVIRDATRALVIAAMELLQRQNP